MVLLNVMIGAIGFMQGSILLLVVVIIEGSFISKVLTKRWFEKRIFFTSFLANITSTSFGLFGILPTVWNLIRKANVENDHNLTFLLALLITCVVEAIINLLMLKSRHRLRPIITSTLYSNLITYLLLYIVFLKR